MNKLIKILSDLKENYGTIAIRTDMASETVTEEEYTIFKNLSKELGLGYTIKIGGSDALTDIYKAKLAGADNIIVPMIESGYAVKKFVDNCKKIYQEKIDTVNLLINIETKASYEKLDEIMQTPQMQYVKGIVLGRDDMVHSMQMKISEINSAEMFKISKNIADKAIFHNKKFIIGGNIRPQATDFLYKLICDKKISNYETRRVIFNANCVDKEIINNGLSKAIEFEIMFLERLKNNNSELSDVLNERISGLKKGCNRIEF